MRILQIIDNINIDAGVASIVMNIYRNIDRSKYQFDFLVSHHGYNRGKTFESEIELMGGKIFYFGAPLSKNLLSATHKARVFFRDHSTEYDVVHLHTPTIAEFTIRFAREYGIRSIITHSHSAMTSTNVAKAKINEFLIERMKKYTNNYWACSSAAADFLFGNMESKSVVVIENAISPFPFSFNDNTRKSIRAKMMLENKTVFVHVSNYTKIKNVHFIVPILKAIVNQNPLFHFMFVGDGPELASVKELVNQLMLTSNCSFVGATDEVGKYLQGADAFFMPSLTEGFGIAAVEAQAAGLPCFLSEGVPREVEVGHVTYIPLSEQLWFEKMNSFRKITDIERKQMSDLFYSSHLNIRNSILGIQKAYDTLTTTW